MKRLLEHFKYWGYTVCGVYALDATFMGDPAKFISGTLLSLSAMVSHQSCSLYYIVCTQLQCNSSHTVLSWSVVAL
jgi:Conserved hypothetical ATP binding protein